MNHNKWAETIRLFLKPALGYDMTEWPGWVDDFIYRLADFLSARKDV